MPQKISPVDQSPVKPAPSVDINLGDEESGRNIDDVECNKSDDSTVFQDMNKERNWP